MITRAQFEAIFVGEVRGLGYGHLAVAANAVLESRTGVGQGSNVYATDRDCQVCGDVFARGLRAPCPIKQLVRGRQGICVMAAGKLE